MVPWFFICMQCGEVYNKGKCWLHYAFWFMWFYALRCLLVRVSHQERGLPRPWIVVSVTFIYEIMCLFLKHMFVYNPPTQNCKLDLSAIFTFDEETTLGQRNLTLEHRIKFRVDELAKTGIPCSPFTSTRPWALWKQELFNVRQNPSIVWISIHNLCAVLPW